MAKADLTTDETNELVSSNNIKDDIKEEENIEENGNTTYNNGKHNNNIIKLNKQTSYDISLGPPISINNWPNKPMCLTLHCKHVSYQTTNYDDKIAIPLNKPFNFESNTFKGVCIARAIDFPDTEKWYFKNKHRKMDFTYQGEFKRKIRFDRLLTGQIFDEKITKLPGQYLISTGLKILKTLAPTLIADIEGTTPHLLSPLCSAAQVFNIVKKGDNYVKLPGVVDEDISILDKKYKGLDWQARKKLFHNKDVLKQYFFEPGYIYTLSHYTHMVSPQSYNLHIAGMKFGIHYYVPSPFQVMGVMLPDEDEKKKYKLVKNNDDNNNNEQKLPDISNYDSKSESFTYWFKDRKPDTPETQIEWNTQGLNMMQCEYVFNFQMWHTNLVKELYEKDKNIKPATKSKKSDTNTNEQKPKNGKHERKNSKLKNFFSKKK